MRRVLQVFNRYLERGGEEIWVEKLPELAGEGFEFEDLCFQSREWTGKDAPSRLSQARLIGDNPASRRRLAEAVESFRPDVLLFHNLIPVASLGLYDEARRLGVPVAQYLHNYRPFSPSGTLWSGGRVSEAALRGNPWPEILAGAWNGSRLKTAILAWHLARLRRSGALEVVRVWIAISEFMRDKLAGAGLPGERLRTLRHCWETPGRPGIADEGDFYLFLGRLHETKGLRTLLDAWRLLGDKFGARTPRLVIAGDGAMQDDVRAAAGRSDRITWAGFVGGDRKAELLARCRALLVPSIWWEPLGLIVHEAYDVARPVIASGTGGLAETVEGGQTGIIHRPGDPRSLAEAVERLEKAGPEGRAAMGMRGREWLLADASPAVWRERFTALIEGL